ncbi:MAG: hypothetical protein LUJ09_03860 [Firmicutes bacterium]|nr:hypothetical protein [Bacillota bacterium]
MQIAGILETVMLICFGFSWPINLVKNYRLRSAKSMSLPFLLLIWFGYVAGVTAKLIALASPEMADPSWYLLAIYIINLGMMCANLAVYFRNARLDKISEKASRNCVI